MSDRRLNVRLTATQRKLACELLPQFEDRLALDKKSARKVFFSDDELNAIRGEVEGALPHAPNGTTRNSLQHIIDAINKALAPPEEGGSPRERPPIYQFKITLAGSKPPVWRRIQVEDCDLNQFHEHIQTAMGWTNSHLYAFDVRGRQYVSPNVMDIGDAIEADRTRVSRIVPPAGKKFCYIYDFGDDWQHDILFEKSLPPADGIQYPVCTAGKRNCPPEDVGGMWGFYRFLEAIADPKHSQHTEMKEWAGDFDPNHFDRDETTESMHCGMPDCGF